MVTLPESMAKAPDLPLLIAEAESLLENERRARDDFRNWLTPDKKAEFINGEIIVHSPARSEHNRTNVDLANILTTFVDLHDLGLIYIEKTLIGLSRNDYEPDLVFYSKSKAVKISAKQIIFPAPDLVVEILSDSTKDYDRGVKFRDYAAHEITEYWIIDPGPRLLERYLNQNGKYVLQPLPESQIIETPLFPGLKLPIQAIFDRETRVEFLKKLRP
jgi:Uma2 family endonuclease